MPKLQGTLPIYDPATKRILGAYSLPYSWNFQGNETTHNIDAPTASSPSNTVPVQKIVPNYQPINRSRKEADWFMAAVFTDAQIRSGYYKQFKNFAPIADMAPDVEITGAASGPQFRIFKGALISGLEGDFSTGAPLGTPVNTVAPTITGTMTAAQVLSINQGSWTEQGGTTISYQWKLDGVNVATTATYTVPGSSVGKIVTCDVTHTFGSSVTVTTAGRAITA